ncbi:glycosyl hydrolase family 18 protein [Algibacter miyuki]|uniref:Glycosyl hydrolase family 18 protein n=1 Tax=Algibacter miyuki TaxID=1306933 RepID=A0ABV5H4G4_9FLAO|nr:glycosyl hydrolase family 18 protein [Algibacter miyuki]MDN3663825.1 glycosyl hydrolase family 18 protein [Algibacter miyuki]
MKHNLQIPKIVFRNRLLVVLFVVLNLCSLSGFGQDIVVKPLPIDLDSTKLFHEKEKGFIQRLKQTLKFKQNKTEKEKDRIYQFMLELVRDSLISVDSNMNEIAKVLDSLKIDDSLKIEELHDKFNINKLAIDSLKIKLVDSLEVVFRSKLDTILSNKLKNYFANQSVLDSVSETSLSHLKSATCTCEWRDAQTKAIKDSISECLNHKVKIIGWHNYWNNKEEEYKNYNYNYLSILNLYDYYDLKLNGGPKYPEKLQDLGLQGGVIAMAKNKGTKINLTVHSKYPTEIEGFLARSESQNRLFNALQHLVDEDLIQGVNIYFEHLPLSSEREFSRFISSLNERFKNDNFSIQITIPAIFKAKSLEYARAYNFAALVPHVNSFIVSTDRMTDTLEYWSQANSPLHSASKPEFGTIASTVDFYSSKIPLTKLIVSVSYLGQEWRVENEFNDVDKSYKGHMGSSYKYTEILRDIKNNKNIVNDIECGYDTIQMAAYINWKQNKNWQTQYKQIWYEDEQSLKEKYRWVLQRGIAGVSIRGLGYDDGYTGLWDAIGTHLIEVKSAKIDAVKAENLTEKRLVEFDAFTRIDSLLSADGDAAWDEIKNHKDYGITDAVGVKVFNTKIFEYGGLFEFDKWFNVDAKDESSIWYKYQPYDYSQNKKSNDERWNWMQKYALYSDYSWALEEQTYYLTAYGRSLQEEVSTKYLADQEASFCLYRRLIVFSKIGFYGAAFFSVLILLTILRINYLDRFNKGGTYQRTILQILSLVFAIIAAVLLFYGLYITPYFSEFGASNQGRISIYWIFIILVLGVLVGIFIHYRYFRGKYSHKNLP